jgi:hypothetical protein
MQTHQLFKTQDMVTNIKYNIMKKLSLLLLSIIVFSCGEHEDVIYDPNTSVTFAFFENGSESLLDVINPNDGVIEVGVGVSTLSNSNRTVTLSIDEELSTASSDQYSVDNLSVTIPSGEYFGALTLTGIAANLSPGTPATVVFKIESVSDNGQFSANPHSVKMTKICPVEADFTGTYTLTTLVGGIFGSQVFANGEVTVSQGSSSITARQFSAPVYPEFGAFPAVTLSFNLACDGVVQVPPGLVTGVGCGSSTTIGPSNNTGSYDSSDDSSFTIIVTDDEGGASCGVAVEAQFLLEKI